MKFKTYSQQNKGLRRQKRKQQGRQTHQIQSELINYERAIASLQVSTPIRG